MPTASSSTRGKPCWVSGVPLPLAASSWPSPTSMILQYNKYQLQSIQNRSLNDYTYHFPKYFLSFTLLLMIILLQFSKLVITFPLNYIKSNKIYHGVIISANRRVKGLRQSLKNEVNSNIIGFIIPLATPEQLSTITENLLNFNLVHDINALIETLNFHITTDFEELSTDKKPLYLEPMQLLHYLTLIFHVVQTRYDDEHGTPLYEREYSTLAFDFFISLQNLYLYFYEGEVILIGKQLAALTFLTEDLITRHMQKLVKKEGGVLVEAFMEKVEEVIYNKGWTEYTDWANVHDMLVKKGQKLVKPEEESAEVNIEEEERKDRERQERKEEFSDSLDQRLEQLKEQYKGVKDIGIATISQVATITQLNLLTKRDSLTLIMLFSAELSPQQKLTLLFDLLENALDVASYEFSDFSSILLPFLKDEIPYDALLADFQLLKRVSFKFYSRLKGRFPELQDFLYGWKIGYVKQTTQEERKELETIEASLSNVEQIEEKIQKLEISEEPTDKPISIQQRLIQIGDDMIKYRKEVDEEWDRLTPFVTDSIKAFVETLKPYQDDPNLFRHTSIVKVGSLDLGTQYTVSKSDHGMDLVIYNENYSDDIPKFQTTLLELFKKRNADIRLRGDDISVKNTYINRRYATLRVGDPYHDVDYSITLYVCRHEEEANHIIRHHDMMKALFESSSFVKTLFINCHSWCKHFLYDPIITCEFSIKFDTFSSYEIQLIFLSFLLQQDLLTANHESDEPQEWLLFTDKHSQYSSGETSQEHLGRLFVEFLLHLATKLDYRVIDFANVMPAGWLKTAVFKHTDDYTCQFTFYQLMLGNDVQYADVRRQLRDAQEDIINLVKMAHATVTGMLNEGRHHFD